MNDAPQLAKIPDYQTTEDVIIHEIPFTVDEGGDGFEDSQILKVTARSSNKDLIPDDNIKIDFQDSINNAVSGVLKIIPAADQNGTSTISCSVSDGLSQVQREFIVTVLPANDLPIISPIEDQVVQEDAAIVGIKLVLDEGGRPR